MRKLIISTGLIILLFGCRKKTKVYSIEGRILQSSSNPVPQGNYKLTFYQKGSPIIPIPIGSSSASATSLTNADGYFNCRFQTGEATFLLIPLSNSSPLTMQGDNNNLHINLYWNNIPARDTVLGNVYLYKQINKAIIKISSSIEILPADTLNITTQTSTGDYKKILSGLSIQPGTVTSIDTISQLISANFDVLQKQYTFSINCVNTTNKKSNANYTFTGPLDEPEREFVIWLQ